MREDMLGRSRPLRHGETWTEGEFEQIIQGLVDGLTIEQIATRLQRTSGSVRGQLGRLVPKDLEIRARDREHWLRREVIAQPKYDWRAMLRSHADSDEAIFWFKDEDDLVRRGWTEAIGLPELAHRLWHSEPAIAQRLIALGLADDVSAVVDRLGVTPGSSLEARARVVRGQLAEALYVLVIEADNRPKVSVHHSQADAERELLRSVGDLSQPAPRWWVIRRSLDGRDLGQYWTNASGRTRLRLPHQRRHGALATKE